MKVANRLLIFFVTALSLIALGSYGEAAVVVFADSALEAVIREQIDIPTGDIQDSDLEAIEILDASGKGVTDISGISQCVNLEVLDLSDNAVMDVSELTALPNLTALDLDDNGLENIGPIASLTNLTSLGLSYDSFLPEDLDLVLASLENLVELGLTGNRLTALGSITTLLNLERLYLGDNQLGDISGLENCIKLSYLDLHKNKITDGTRSITRQTATVTICSIRGREATSETCPTMARPIATKTA
ncbi:MAG: leucine-rich repeat domain-containing protein [Deltaproteobacteria bacterium]|nr:leucine-rich repeat domain-containing protein [Deltaproteobacteria bacterium]